MRKIFRKKKINFFDLLWKQSEMALGGMKQLYEYCTTCSEQSGDMVVSIEEDGDKIQKTLINELHKTFVTPIERNDIFDLSRMIDEILDYAKTTVDQIRLFKIKPDESIIEMVGILVDICTKLNKAVYNIDKSKKTSKSEALKVKRLENDMANRHYKALAELFESQDIRSIFKYQDVYRHLNKTADIADMAMDCLLNILNTL